MKQKLLSKKASVAVSKAIAVITAVVLGSAMMVGGAGVIKTVVLPSTTTKVNSMFGMTGDIAGGGGTGGGSMGDDINPVVGLKRNGVIPTGGVYYRGTEKCTRCGNVYGIEGMNHGLMFDNYTFTEDPTETYTGGDNFPSTVEEGDIYVEGDFRYCYFSEDNGWRVSVMEDKSSYDGVIVAEINNKPVTSMLYAFYGCSSLAVAPTLPNSVVNLHKAFEGCHSLRTAPAIPSGVTDLSDTFASCSKLTVAPILPDNIVNMCDTFYNCMSLKTYVGSTDPDGDFSNYKIPNSVTNMSSTFQSCVSLTVAPVIPNGVTNAENLFSECEALKGIFVYLPLSVTNPSGTMGSWTDGPPWVKQ